MKLLKKTIAELEVKQTKYYVMDDDLDNFGIKIYPSGKKSYIVRVRFNGSKKEYVLADSKDKTLPEAKDLARDIIKKYKDGIDVKLEEKKQEVHNKSFIDCINDYLPKVKDTTAKDIQKCKGRLKANDKLKLKIKITLWTKWLDKPIRNITQLMLLKAYDRRVKESQHRARLESAYLRSIWNHHKKELNLDESPTVILNEERKGWSKKTVNTRRLDLETSSTWFMAIQSLPERDKNLFQLIYFSGLRASEAMNLEWKMIDFGNNSLHIPDTKNGSPLDIPLNSHAIAVFTSILNGEFKHRKYIFPQTNRAGDIISMNSYSKSLTKLKKLNVFWSPHDSRRGFINAGGVTGCNSYMIKQLVNHTDNESAHAGYNHYTVGELRPATQTIGDYLEKQLVPKNNVVEFKRIA